jgi:hypothetical protein
MYCPRCGTQAQDTTKFCRRCGLALMPLTDYVASGGTSPLVASEPPKSTNAMVRAFQELEPRQQMIFTILFFVFLGPILGILSGIFPLFRGLVPLAFVGMPLGIVWAVMRYKAIERRMQQQRFNASLQTPPPVTTPMPPQQTYQPPLSPQPTNPLDERPRYPSSVTEEETQRLPQPPSQKA